MAQKGFNGLDEEEVKRVQEAIKASGLTDREWINLVASTYLMQQLSLSPDHQKDIATIRQATSVMLDTVTNMIKRSVFEVEQLERKSEADRAGDQLIIQQLKTRIATAEEEKKKMEESVARMEERVREAEGRAEAAVRADEKNSLIIDGLQKQVKDLEEDIARCQEDQERLAALESERSSLENQVRELDGKHKEAVRETEAARVQHEKELADLQTRHGEELQRKLEKKDLDYEREMVRVQGEYQKKIESLQAEHSEKVSALYERIEQARNPGKSE